MARLHPAITAHVQVPAFLGGDDPHVFALGLRTFAGAAGDAELHFVRGADAFVAVFQFHAEADAVADPVAAPGATDAGFRHPQRFGVGVAGFEARFNQLTPDLRQVVFLRAKQADALGAGDFGVQIEFTRDTAHGDQPFRRDFAASGARDHRVGAIFLNVGKEVVVGVLQRRVLRFEDVLIPAGGQQRADGRLTDLAAITLTVFFQQFVEGFNAFHADQVEQLLAGVSEVFAQVVVDLDALFRQFGIEHLRHQRDTTPAAGSGFGFRFQRRDGVAAFVDGGDQVAFTDVKAGADLRAVRQFIDADRRLAAAGVGRKDQRIRIFRQLDSVEHQLQQIAIVAGVADQHRAEQRFIVGADDQALINFFAFVEIDVATGARRTAVGIADPAHVHTQQLQLGAEVGAGEAVFTAEEMVDGHLGHFITRGDEAIHAVVPAGAFPDGVDIRVGGLAAIVDHDAAALGDRQPALGGQLIARADPG
ncbi:Uncharacterised protein [Klebsiella aerogenes]|nr:Uncharacterised protein [Klebsiella aerogenes]